MVGMRPARGRLPLRVGDLEGHRGRVQTAPPRPSACRPCGGRGFSSEEGCGVSGREAVPRPRGRGVGGAVRLRPLRGGGAQLLP